MTATHVDAIRMAVGALNEGDVGSYLAAFSEGCERWVPGGAEPLTREEAAAGLELVMRTFDVFRLDEVLLFGAGRHVCARWSMVGTHTGAELGVPPTGRSVAVETAEIYEFDAEEGGLVRASWAFGDPTAMLQQLGVAPVGSA